MSSTTVDVYDTTLRDGTQGEGISLSVGDKLTIARLLDELGVDFIEGGWPGANPKDSEFFARAAEELTLHHAQLAAFGATRRAGVAVADDPQVAALLEANTAVVCLVAKSHAEQVEVALRTSLEENLAMITDTVSYLTGHGRKVFVDAEHFFDGYAAHPDYALQVVRAAADAGAHVVVLCDTNGGSLPEQVGAAVAAVHQLSGANLGIHCHNDSGVAVANTLAAVQAGAMHVQAVANGYGERCGNADLFTVVAALQLKLGRTVLPAGRLQDLTRISHAIAEVANRALPAPTPYVGASAFAHKGGLHASAVKIRPDLYQHIDPRQVGNDTRMLVSELAGRASVELKSRELGVDLSDRPEALTQVVELVKQREAVGYSYEAADASFELLLRDVLAGAKQRPFQVESWRVLVEHRRAGDPVPAAEATVKVHAQGQRLVAIGEGNGPVNALDAALRLALEPIYPQLTSLKLTDYKVRIIDTGQGTAATTRVLIDTTDGKTSWSTVGVGQDIVEASWQALEDAVSYGLLGS